MFRCLLACALCAALAACGQTGALYLPGQSVPPAQRPLLRPHAQHGAHPERGAKGPGGKPPVGSSSVLPVAPVTVVPIAQ
ncbi:MAG TPA: lipoprotein [Nevskiaceae bacterium]|nr:lipoprotein [Nevskiaceae bacterium]